MKRNWIIRVLVLALLVAALSGFAAGAEGFDGTPTVNVTLGRGESYKVDTSSILTTGAQALRFKSLDEEIATVSADGVITARKKGSVAVGVGYDRTLLGLCKVTVTAAPKRVRLSEDMLVLSVGDTRTLRARITKGSASALSFSSANAAVAKVDAGGVVTALSGGKTTVTVRTYNGKTARCDVYVLGGRAPTALTLNVSDLTIQVGESFRLEASVDAGSDALYKYASMNRKVAKVSGDGIVTGVRTGSTVVAVQTHNGLTQTVNVAVKPKLKDLYGCLTNDSRTYLQAARKLKLTRDAASAAGSVIGRNGEVTLTLTADSCEVALSAVANPRYCVQGVDVSMTPQSAAAKLIAGGWAQTAGQNGDGLERRVFVKGGDTPHTITIATADGETISGISARWEW